TVKEDKVPKGYAKAPDQTVKVKAGQTSTVTFEDYPKDDPIGIVLRKGDSELGTNKAQGKATLAGAVYEIKYYKHTDDGNKLDRTWRVITNANGIAHLSEDDLDPSFDNDEFYYSAAGDPCFPLGTVTVQEVKAPTGYEKNSQIYTCKITGGSGTTESVSTYNIPKIGSDEEMAEDVKRGDLEFVKVADGTLERLAGVPFKITSLTTGESHVIVTDKNGYASTASSWNKHTNNTNRGKYSTDGIWFGEGAPDNSKGALIYDDYVIEEQPCDANKGMNLLTVTVSIYKNNVTVPLGTLTDDQIEITTTAKDEDSDSHIGMVQETVYIKDTVEYKGLKKGETYRLEGKLMNKETGKAITASGKAVTAETTFTPKMTDGQVDVEFEVPGSAVRGKALVVFEDLFLGDIKLATHADIDDEGQTVYYPDVTTKAKDSETKVGVGKADGKVTLVDTVSYSGVMTDKKYTVIGMLMDKATGKPIVNGDKEVTASAEFTPKAMSGTVDVTFTFDGKHLKGKEVVVYETLKYHNREVAYHHNLEDDGQTIFFPEIGTKAVDSETKIGVSNPDKSVTLVDTVSYEGLRPGLEYKMTGMLVDKATGNAVENITAVTTFTPAKSKGTVDVTFNFNGKSLEGKTVVVYETLTYKGIELADHKDINDDGQTIYFPDIWTSAKDTEFDDHISMADEDVTIVDKVSYEGLRPGIEYKVVGRLMNKDTGEPVKVNGADVRAEAKFTPKDSKGSVNVTFNF
ncbi:MAG: VaFE repeat-containing surface-anchored protein, partial [Firmicutes bacterium]|nr:VaFE repeat-containing surface-anchored protein [Bacillota bacterium]